jgi:hypothetical protein
MKNLSKRSKMLLAMAGVVILVIAAGVAILKPSGFGLFGTSTYPYISPSYSSIMQGKSETLRIVGNPALPAPVCTWSVSSGLQLIGSNATSVTIFGSWQNTATVTAKCNVGTAYATVSITPNTTRIYLR